MLDPVSTVQSVTAEEAKAVSALWWVLLLFGIASIAVGLFILGHDWTIDSLAVFIGIILIFEGLFSGVTPGLGSMRFWTIGMGLLAIIAGIAILVWPARGLLVVAEVIAAYVVVKGVFSLATSISSRHVVSYWWLGTLLGIVEIAVGIWLIRRPGITLYLVIILTGVWLVVQGTLQIVLAFELKKLPHLLARSQAEHAAVPPSPVAPGP
jgi:uncharacterized membrane protein HdeD (DUF308 family)